METGFVHPRHSQANETQIAGAEVRAQGDQREVGAPGQPDGLHKEIYVIALLRAGSSISNLHQKAAAHPERAQLEYALGCEDLMAVREHIPDAVLDGRSESILLLAMYAREWHGPCVSILDPCQSTWAEP